MNTKTWGDYQPCISGPVSNFSPKFFYFLWRRVWHSAQTPTSFFGAIRFWYIWFKQCAGLIFYVRWSYTLCNRNWTKTEVQLFVYTCLYLSRLSSRPVKHPSFFVHTHFLNIRFSVHWKFSVWVFQIKSLSNFRKRIWVFRLYFLPRP